MVNAARLIDEVLGKLQSFSQDSEQVTTLSADVAPGDLGFTVTAVRSGVMGLSPGIIEMGTELLYCDHVASDGTATVAPWGRGYADTTAATHLAGTRVTSAPNFPRFWVLEALNETISRIFPQIFVAKKQTFTTTFPVVTYDLPDDAEFVLDVKWQPPTGTSYWQQVRRWRLANGGSTVAGDPGVSMDVGDRLMPGRPMVVTYASPATPFATETDDFTVTGLPTGLRDVLVLGAASQLTESQELSRLQTFSIEQQDRARLVAPSAALTASRFLEQKFQARLKEETVSLRRKYPPRIVREWV